jgi:hypothetical protein
VSEALLQRCLLVSVRPLAGPLEQGSISIRLGAILVDAVVPLSVRNIVGSITEQERSVVEFDSHSVSPRTFPTGFNMWVVRDLVKHVSVLL